MGLAGITFDLARRWWGVRAGWVVLCVLYGNGMFLTLSKYAMTDMTMSFFFALAIWCFWRFYESRRSAWMLGSCAALGLAYLTKGLPAALLPATVIVAFLVCRKELGLLKKMRCGSVLDSDIRTSGPSSMPLLP